MISSSRSAGFLEGKDAIPLDGPLDAWQWRRLLDHVNRAAEHLPEAFSKLVHPLQVSKAARPGRQRCGKIDIGMRSLPPLARSSR